jgi:hypothetical protein
LILPSFKTDAIRENTNKWVEAKLTSYGGDDLEEYKEDDALDDKSRSEYSPGFMLPSFRTDINRHITRKRIEANSVGCRNEDNSELTE